MARPTSPMRGRFDVIAWATLPCLVVMTVGIALALQACGGGDCTELGCTAGAEVVFSQALDDSETYTIKVVADGDATSCEVNLTEDYDCPTLQFFVTGSGATVTDSGARLPSAGFAGLLVPGNPRELEVEILRADRTVGSVSTTPEYRGVEVNGAGCGACRLATSNMDVSP